MKKINRMFKSFFSKSAPVAESVVATEHVHQLKPDFELIRFSIWIHFRLTQANKRYLLEYNSEIEPIIETLRLEGWRIDLNIDFGGMMTYSIAPALRVSVQ
ncbi:MAG: hypothetical protein EOO09_10255 [Chitinophagaceae bacterium]|nr:MAG: hypothetical protein EOO09_10255 [Chitinophagaceae bacterium]